MKRGLYFIVVLPFLERSGGGAPRDIQIEAPCLLSTFSNSTVEPLTNLVINSFFCSHNLVINLVHIKIVFYY